MRTRTKSGPTVLDTRPGPICTVAVSTAVAEGSKRGGDCGAPGSVTPWAQPHSATGIALGRARCDTVTGQARLPPFHHRTSTISPTIPRRKIPSLGTAIWPVQHTLPPAHWGVPHPICQVCTTDPLRGRFSRLPAPRCAAERNSATISLQQLEEIRIALGTGNAPDQRFGRCSLVIPRAIGR